jgi:3-phenylpropionate/trans-cinnamate dioxygenase ferredoxin reductase subunit
MEEQQVSIRDVRSVGPGGIAVTFETPSGFSAQPGQFVKLSASIDGEDVSRIYTISSPTVAETFETTVEVDEDGTLGPWLANATGGETLHVTGPFGDAHYEGEDRVVVLAGGPGIGPAIAIAERAVADDGTAAIVYQDERPFHRDRLDALEGPAATVTITGPQEDLLTPVGDVVTDDPAAQVFVYGFSDFVDAASTALEDCGRPVDDAKIESFG